MNMKRWALALLCGVSLWSGCSLRSIALNSVADALSGPGGGYGSEEDPELARLGAPFGLKTMEQIAESLPKHRQVRISLASGFTQYAYAFINEDADRAADKTMSVAQAGWQRAKRMYLRGRDHALASLEIAYPGATAAIRGADVAARQAVLDKMTRDDVPALYWCGASWALALAASKGDTSLLADLGNIDAVMARALALHEDYDEGALHEFYVSFDASRGEDQGGGAVKAKQHLDRANVLSAGRKLGVLVSYAEAVLVSQQDKAGFVAMMKKVIDTDVYQDDPAWRRVRLGNLIAHERARWLMSKLSELFAQ